MACSSAKFRSELVLVILCLFFIYWTFDLFKSQIVHGYSGLVQLYGFYDYL